MRAVGIDTKEIERLRQEYEGSSGEANLFVLRAIAARKKGGVDFLLSELAQHYKIIAVKPVSWKFKWFKSKSMRGGKWKRGGKPAFAVVVFDPEPIDAKDHETSDNHPCVFNARQFCKPTIREKFSRRYGTKIKLNPLHSTDNEFEAWEHLPLFFTPEEIQDINRKVAAEREE